MTDLFPEALRARLGPDGANLAAHFMSVRQAVDFIVTRLVEQAGVGTISHPDNVVRPKGFTGPTTPKGWLRRLFS